MAFKPALFYPNNWLPGSAARPNGNAKPSTTDTSKDGSPWDIDYINDKEGFWQGLLLRAGIDASGNPDTVLISDYLDALSTYSGRIVNTIQALIDIPVDARIGTTFALGFYAAVDGGGDRYFWDPTASKMTHNGGTIIDPDIGVAPGAAGWWTPPGSGLGVYKAQGDIVPNVIQFGSKKDGASDDSAAFIAGESAIDGGILVPVGSYELGSTDFAGKKFYSYGDITVITNTTITIKNLLSDEFSSIRDHGLGIVNRKKTVLPEFNGEGAINIMGDSISAGAFANNLYLNGWTRLLGRMFNAENDASSYGYTPYLTLGSGPTESTDVHSVSFDGSWSNSGNGGDLLSGLALRNAIVGSKITFTVPHFQDRAVIWFVTQPGGGTFTIKVNGNLLNTINTNAAQDNFSNQEIALTDNSYGLVTIEIEITVGGDVDFAGISYFSADTEATVNNFSESGRKLADVSDAVIQHLAENSSVLVMALGHNDTAGAAFTASIDSLINHCNANQVKLYVPDFRWTSAPIDAVRLELKRLADSVYNATYIPFPDYLKPNGETVDSAYLISTLNMWEDGSHPNVEGNQYIVETIASIMGLSCSSKKDALHYHDYWYPLELDPVVDVENVFLTPASAVSSFKRSGNVVYIKAFLRHDVAGSFPVGNYLIQPAWPVKSGFGGVTQGTTKTGVIRNDTGAVVSNIEAGASGSIRLHIIDGSWITNQQIDFILPAI